MFDLVCLLLITFVGQAYETDYGLVIDAGSTQSQLFIYKYAKRMTTTNSQPKSTPIQIAASGKASVIHTLNTQSDANGLLGPMIEFAKSELKESRDKWENYPIYVKATAGMRVIPNAQRQNILTLIENALLDPIFNPFAFEQSQCVIASGEEEATFDWLAVNFIFNRLTTEVSTFGVLDLGGQSTQIAFIPDAPGNILEDLTAIKLWHTTYRIYTHSFLKYGVNAVEQRIAQKLYVENEGGIVYNPCLNTGYNQTYMVEMINGTEIENKQYGNSATNIDGCYEIVRSLLGSNDACFTEPCSFNNVYQPALPINATFVAFSGFGYTVEEDLGLPTNISLYDLYFDVGIKICNMTWQQMQESKWKDNIYVSRLCRRTTYIYVLLHEGYGFDAKHANIIWTNRHNDSILSWTQGSMLRDSNWLPYDIVFAADIQSSEINIVALMVVCVIISCLFCCFIAPMIWQKMRKQYSSVAMASDTDNIVSANFEL